MSAAAHNCEIPASGLRPAIYASVAGTLRSFAAGLRDHAPLLALITAYLFLAFLTEWGFGLKGMVRFGEFSSALTRLTPLFLAVFLAGYTVWWMMKGLWMVRVGKPEPLFRSIWRDLRGNYLTPAQLTGFLIVFLTLPIFTDAKVSFKKAIPRILPFQWDQTFMEWDRWLHGGKHAWEWLTPLLQSPGLVALIDVLYHPVWLLLLFSVVFWQAWSRNRELRMRFLFSYVLMWVFLGTAGAILLSSAGPCYYDRVAGDARMYAPLMERLYEINAARPLNALELQDMLWQAYVAGGHPLVKGISAMPSMHVASSVLMALLAWKVHRMLGMAFTAYAVVIQVGSVLLGWHYAIDGYVAAVGTVGVWCLAGWWVRRLRLH